MKTTIDDATALAAVSHFAPRKDHRYYLNGVRIEPDGEAHVILVGSDGVTLAAQRCAGYAPEAFTLGFSDEALSAVRRKANGGKAVTVEEEALSVGSALARVWAVSGEYPDWRAAMPTGAASELPPLDPRLVARLEKAARAAFPVMRLWPMEGGAVVARLDEAPEFFAVVMGVDEKKRPAWTDEAYPEWFK